MPFEWSLNPYRGCLHGCAFCYARATHSFLGLETDDTFQRHILVKENAPDSLAAQLERMARRHGGDLDALAGEIGVLAIGTATDPYQPIEARRRVTRACLEVLAEYRVPVTVTTRSPLILRDVDVLRRMNVVAIHISVNTVDRDVWRSLEPTSPSPSRRLEAVRTLVAEGLPAGIFVAPILPRLTDRRSSLEALAAAAREAGARFAVPSLLRLAPEVKAWFFSVLKARYPAVLPVYQTLYRDGRSYPPAAYSQSVLVQAERILAAHGLPTRSYESTVSRSSSPVSSENKNRQHQHNETVQMVLPI
jgi:DNA repair photolyase